MMIPWEVKVVRPRRRWGNMTEKVQWKVHLQDLGVNHRNRSELWDCIKVPYNLILWSNVVNTAKNLRLPKKLDTYWSPDWLSDVPYAVGVWLISGISSRLSGVTHSKKLRNRQTALQRALSFVDTVHVTLVPQYRCLSEVSSLCRYNIRRTLRTRLQGQWLHVH